MVYLTTLLVTASTMDWKTEAVAERKVRTAFRMKGLRRTTRVFAEIRARHLWNARQKCYRLSQFARSVYSEDESG
jgi:hypothetical protein